MESSKNQSNSDTNGAQLTEKERRELAVFSRFLELSKLDVDPGSIRPGDVTRRETDVVCNVAGMGLVGFELTQIAEQDFMQSRAMNHAINLELRKQFQALEPPLRQLLMRNFGNADIGVLFSHEYGMRAMVSGIADVFDALREMPQEFFGTQKLNRREGRSLQWISVTRNRSNEGPTLFVQQPAGWVGDATIARIAEKLTRTYSEEPPRRELITYFGDQPPTLETVRLPALDDYLSILPNLGPFSRIWVVDFWSGVINRTYSLPPIA